MRFLQSIQTTQPNPRWHWAVQRLVAGAAERIVVPSPSAADVARRWAGAAAGRVVVVPNAVDVESFDATYRTRRPVNPAHFVVGFIGRLDPVKRVPHLVRAMAQLPGASLHVYGDGPDRRRIEAEIARLKLGDRVALLGAIPRPHAALAAVDVLVLPSAAEGFGLVLIEAMAAGVPVAAADVAGIRDVVDHGRTGLLFAADANPAAIAAAVDGLRQTGTREVLVRTARQQVALRYGWETVLASYRRLLNCERPG